MQYLNIVQNIDINDIEDIEDIDTTIDINDIEFKDVIEQPQKSKQNINTCCTIF
jgi:hypothetical protein